MSDNATRAAGSPEPACSPHAAADLVAELGKKVRQWAKDELVGEEYGSDRFRYVCNIEEKEIEALSLVEHKLRDMANTEHEGKS